MRRLPLAIAAILVLAIAATVYLASPGPPKAKLNVLFVTIDTLRADHLGSYGYLRDTSPRIDRLADEGVRFSQGIVQWPKTSPSFASMLTSTYGYYNGIQRLCRQRISGHFDLLAEVFKEAGYQTVGVVTNANLATFYHFDQGFDTYVEGWRDLESTNAKAVTDYALEWLRGRESKSAGIESSDGGPAKTDVSAPAQKPFFMWLHYIDPHSPYAPPEGHRDRYLGDVFYDGERRAVLNEGQYEAFGGIPQFVQLPDPDAPEKASDVVDYYIALYDAEIRFMDEQIGRVLDAVESMGLADDTMVVLTADHGESLGDHNYYFEHGMLPYDACSRVPLIFRVPGMQTRAKVFDEPVELINVMPTILDVVGLPLPVEAQGRTLVPFMTDDEDDLPRYTFTESGFSENYQRSIRRDQWKLIFVPAAADRDLMRGVQFELYDVLSDPLETKNLADVETEIVEELREELFAWIDAGLGSRHPAASSQDVDIDEKTEKALRELGYTK